MVTINGSPQPVVGMTLAEYLAAQKYDPQRIAVERNDAIVPKEQYPQVRLAEGDVVEIVSFVGGG